MKSLQVFFGDIILGLFEWLFSPAPRPVITAKTHRMPGQSDWLKVELHAQNFSKDAVTLRSIFVRKPLSVRMLGWSAGTRHDQSLGEFAITNPLPADAAKLNLPFHTHMEPYGAPDLGGHLTSESKNRLFVHLRGSKEAKRIVLSVIGLRSRLGKKRRIRIPVEITVPA
ncbi:MAG: hypothetical protein GY789_28190 [Hyphomicrobiales bacterium]|nr:hypothetical protein [Hyphomicrobiales bacterium]MCP5000169.1 hypothetical protein [Hyphomicrobiales bacterium]